LIRKNYNAGQQYFLRGGIYAGQGMENEAVLDYEEALKEYSDDYEMYYNIYYSLHKAGFENRAISYLRRALEVDGADNFVKGKTYYIIGDYENAMKFLSKAIDDGMQEAEFYLAMTYEKLGKGEEAVSMYEAYLKSYPSDAGAYNQYGVYCMNKGDYNSALGYFAAGLALGDTDAKKELMFNQACCYEYMYQFKTAYEKFGELIEFQIANGTDAIIVCGTTGESSTLTHEEHLDTIKYCVDKVAKRIPVVAGTGSNCTETAVYLSQEAEKYGVDGILLVSPYYNKATQKGLYRHFKTVADSVKVPAILYNVPSRTCCNILPETVVKLCKDVENIVGVKEASGNISQIAHLAAIGQGVVDIYSGNDDQIVPILALGGVGVISVLSNVAPTQTHEICQKFFDGDVAGSRQMQLDAMDLCNALFCEVNPIPVKTALNMMGMGAGAFRMPLCEMEEANAKRLEKALKDYGVL